jgi:N6-L-threonylcarbamoyladenine synthase
MSSTILAIETSCDETGVALVEKSGHRLAVLAEGLSSQVDIHRLTGGVVPEKAAREHTTALRPLVDKVFREANRTLGEVDAIAVTVGPGLMPALSTGVTAARALAFAWNKPIVPVHHIEGHIASALLLPNNAEFSILNFQFPKNAFPALALVVSGGHTMLVHVGGYLQYKVIGTTRDDAAGEVLASPAAENRAADGARRRRGRFVRATAISYEGAYERPQRGWQRR